MAKFKVGDKVILKSDVTLGKVYNKISLSNRIYEDLENRIKIDGFLTINSYGSTETVVRVKAVNAMWYVGEDALELYQEQPHAYQIGDIVRIKKREGNDGDYPFSFSNYMSSLAGTICLIVGIDSEGVCASDVNRKYFNGDYSCYKLKPLDSSDKRDFGYDWHSSMFELITSPSKIQLQAISLNVGNLVPICGMFGKIELDDNYYLDFDNISDQEHISCCKKLRELVPNFDRIANEFGTVYNTERLFPEFSTIDELMRFVQAINTKYNSKQPTIFKKSETYEIRFQKPKTSSIRGSVPTGRAICGRRRKTAIELGHLSNATCHC